VEVVVVEQALSVAMETQVLELVALELHHQFQVLL
jgi:hypothetical protein